MRLTALAASLPATVPFVGPETEERRRGRVFTARLGANESPFGPSPRAVAAVAAAAGEAWKYGDPEMHDLRAEIAAHHGVAPENVMVGEGIDGLLGCLVRLLVAPGTPVVTSAGAYPTFAYHVAGFGGRLVTVPYREDAADPEALGRATREAAAPLVYLANPDNPTGSVQPGARIADMVRRLPSGAMLCLDEAYADFAPPSALPPLDPGEPRVVRLRTFSKAHGLAGLRVGYALGHPEFIAAFDRVRNHFGVGRVAQAGARAALADRAWLAHVAGETAAARDRLAAIGRQNGLVPLASATNFVAFDCGHDGAHAGAVLAALLDLGIFARKPAVAPLDRCVRVTAGSPADLDAFAAALPAALARAAEASGAGYP